MKRRLINLGAIFTVTLCVLTGVFTDTAISAREKNNNAIETSYNMELYFNAYNNVADFPPLPIRPPNGR